MKYIVILFTLAKVDFVLATPVVTEELQEILYRQAERVSNGNYDLTAYRGELVNLADRNDPVAQFLYSAVSVAENIYDELVEKYLHASAKNGCAGSAGILAIVSLSKDKFDIGLMWLRFAARNGDAVSQLTLGQSYIDGNLGLAKDVVEGFAWQLMAIEQTFSKAIYGQLELSRISNRQFFENPEVQSRYKTLKKRIGVHPFYACGQTLLTNDRNS